MARRARKERTNHEYWQVFADLAMGLMAMLTLVLIMVLSQQNTEKEKIEEQLEDLKRREAKLADEKARVDKEKTELIAQSGQFAQELQALLHQTFHVVRSQNAAEVLIRSVFDGECKLVLAENGMLAMKGELGNSETTELYRGGAFTMSPTGRAALMSCRVNFERLASCLGWSVTPDEQARREKLAFCLGRDAAARGDPHALMAAQQLSEGVEALVLSGSTDSKPYADPESGKIPNPIMGLRHDRNLQRSPLSFFSNAYLGAERARQAMGNLLFQVQDRAADDYDALPVLMSRIRVETSSFGQFQVGPVAWRDPACNGDATNPDGTCDAARRLSLNVRWSKDALREPLDSLRMSFCSKLSDPESTFSVNLVTAGKSLESARDELGCEKELEGAFP